MVEEFCKKYGVSKDDVVWIDLQDTDLSKLKALSESLIAVKYVRITKPSINQELLNDINNHLTNYFCFRRVDGPNDQDIVYENKFHTDPVWPGIDVSGYENTYIRGKPKEYLLHTISLFKQFTKARTILEIGSVRAVMEHTIDEFNPACCNDGHSTYFWSHYTGAEVHTVDNHPHRKRNIMDVDARLSSVFAHTADGIEFIKNFDQEIDLLFLDAWDVIPDTPYAERHLEAYIASKQKLAASCLVLIDDTDVGGGGKGRLVIPELKKDGFQCIANRRQTIFLRTAQ